METKYISVVNTAIDPDYIMTILFIAILSFIISLLLGSFNTYCYFLRNDQSAKPTTPIIYLKLSFRIISIIIVTLLSLFSAWAFCIFYIDIDIIR